MPPPVRARFRGQWELVLDDDRYQVRKNGETMVEGEMAMGSKEVIFTDTGGVLGCREPGTERGRYAVSETDPQLILSAVEKRCNGRALVLNRREWSKTP